jgi:alpha-glutamyl/putrescinyl thymine pyrophosphorylase clade 1
MLISKVKKLKPKDRLLYFINEREAIRRKREAGKPRPWTDDEILNTYRFCNVRRMDDTVSSWLYDNWYVPYFDHVNMLFAIALARFINKPESLALITEDVFPAKAPHWARIKAILRKYRDKGNTVFNGAYMVRGNDGIDKIECVVDHYVKPLLSLKDMPKHSMQEAHAYVLASYGMGSFMAGQIIADARWAVQGTWEDRDVWAPMGPGSKRGMNRLFENPPKAPMKADLFEVLLADLIFDLKHELPESISSRLEAHDYQNCLCEIDKYERTLWSEGKPKRLLRSNE